MIDIKTGLAFMREYIAKWKSIFDISLMKTSIPTIGLAFGVVLLLASATEYIAIYTYGMVDRLSGDSPDFKWYLISSFVVAVSFISTWVVRGNDKLNRFASLMALLHIFVALMRYDIFDLITRNYHWYVIMSAVYLIISGVRGKKYEN